jgi:alpha-L-fucosidase
MADRMDYAQLLNDGSEIRIIRHGPTKVLTHMKARVDPEDLALELPVQKPDVAVPVIELFLKKNKTG